MSVAAIDLPLWRPPRAVDRRLAGILLASLLLHVVLVMLHVALTQLPHTPPPPLLATLRLHVAAPAAAPQPLAEPPAASAQRAAAVSPKARQGVTREEPRPARALTPAEPAITAAAAPAVSPAPNPLPAAEPPAGVRQVAAAPATPAPEAAAEALSAYRRQLTELFARPHEYPRIAALRGWEGEVRLRLKVARKGNLLGVQLDRSSGFEVLDRDAVAMLEGYGQLPPLPEAIDGNEISVVVPIAYRLKKTT